MCCIGRTRINHVYKIIGNIQLYVLFLVVYIFTLNYETLKKYWTTPTDNSISVFVNDQYHEQIITIDFDGIYSEKK